MTNLYPRLSTQDAHTRWQQLRELGIPALKQQAKCNDPAEYFAATGGNRIEKRLLETLADDIRALAKTHGYPDKAKQKAIARFDFELAVWLHDNLEIIQGEALRQETWAFLSLCVIPDVVKWRFPEFHHSRCLGGRRDCMQRLWLRARAFDLGEKATDRWKVLEGMTEDAFVSIMERPSLSGNPEICKYIGIIWLNLSNKSGISNMEKLNREAIRRLRAKLTLINLDYLDYEALKVIIEDCFGVNENNN
mgnify:CR=1 FL=1